MTESDMIEIVSSPAINGWAFKGGYEGMVKYTSVRCSLCETIVYPQYVYIIRKFKEANLLGKDYPLLCCSHFKAKEKRELQERRREQSDNICPDCGSMMLVDTDVDYGWRRYICDRCNLIVPDEPALTWLFGEL